MHMDSAFSVLITDFFTPQEENIDPQIVEGIHCSFPSSPIPSPFCFSLENIDQIKPTCWWRLGCHSNINHHWCKAIIQQRLASLKNIIDIQEIREECAGRGKRQASRLISSAWYWHSVCVRLCCVSVVVFKRRLLSLFWCLFRNKERIKTYNVVRYGCIRVVTGMFRLLWHGKLYHFFYFE